MIRSVIVTCALGVIPAAASAGSVDASYYSRMANRPILLAREPAPGASLPAFKVFVIRNGDCPPGQLERYVSGSAQLGVGPSRSCVAQR